jgi:hypothetical protein
MLPKNTIKTKVIPDNNLGFIIPPCNQAIIKRKKYIIALLKIKENKRDVPQSTTLLEGKKKAA